MDGIHDLGGVDGFGAIVAEHDEPVFHQRWEGRAFAMSTAMGAAGEWNIDVGRHGIERLPPLVYLSSSYYERWLRRLELMLIEHGLVLESELANEHSDTTGRELPRGTFTKERVATVLQRGSFTREPQRPPRFQPDERVRARNIHPRSHTRLPRYVRGRTGVVERLHGAHVFPDSIVSGQGEDPQWLYTVRFDGQELWGDDAEPGTTVSIDAFEPYLEAVP
ncbi:MULTISPECIES: nitrile hydratase subunit beta [unclassified Mycobacterium]|uniref:nitrile hydratase subunit beta n=1 Tax=unclassified Mycobacterium TaxID=2642494 RepID=UPI0029C99235|nr:MULTISPECIES: nitrile hydratase subunit beta [unclassified Mycobacterium]